MHLANSTYRKIKKIVLLLIVLTTTYTCSYAQYFTTGSSDIRLRWGELKDDNYKIIFPDYYLPKAILVEGYLDSIQSQITYGLVDKVDKIPIVLFSEKAQSNGLVTWTPKRMELYTIPSTDAETLPWLKQLTVHEYRHVVQISNLNRKLIKKLGYLIGQQAVGASTAIIPTWFYEGDATLAETQFAIWGRGKQPQFSNSTRALFAEHPELWNYEKWRATSFKYEYPSIYEMGYFTVWAGQTFYDPKIWEVSMDYTARRPVRAIFRNYDLKKIYGVSRRDIANRTAEELTAFWHESAQEPNSYDYIDNSYKYYEKNESPILIDDSTVLVVRTNKSVVSSFVTTNINSGKSRVLANSVYINSRPIIVDNYLYWSEFKPSILWENSSHSVVRKAKITQTSDGYRLSDYRTITNAKKDAFFVTDINGEMFAYINFDKLNNPRIVITDSDFNTINSFEIDGWDTTVLTMTFDTKTQKLYLVVVDNNGVSLIGHSIMSNEKEIIKEPSHVTISNMKADNGKLYYNSPLSGKDQIHIYDLIERKEYQVTTSKFGAYSPTIPFKNGEDSTIVITGYKFDGYRIALQNLDNLTEIESTSTPNDKLIPKWHDWGVIKIDTVNITTHIDTTTSNYSRYRKFSNSINIHSWAPMRFNPIELLSESSLDVGLGATAISQNVLGGVIACAGYGYVPSTKMGILTSSIELTTLPVHFSIDFDYGGSLQNVYNYNDLLKQTSFDLKPYASTSLSATLPINLSEGRRARYITPYIGYIYDNSIVIKSDNSVFNGLNKLSYGLSYQSYKYKAERDLEIPLGYIISFINSFNPVTSDFGNLYSLYGVGYLPGLVTNHSLTIKANLQYQEIKFLNFQQKSLYPRGCDYNFSPEKLFASSIDYQLPLIYPEIGIRNLIFFRRISLDLFGEYAYATTISKNQRYTLTPYTYGGEIMFDYTLLGTGTNFYTGISIYKPSESNKVMVGFSFNVSI